MKSFESMREVLNEELDKVEMPIESPPVLSDTVRKQIITGCIADKGLAEHFGSDHFTIPRYIGPLMEGNPEQDGGLDFQIIFLIGREFCYEFTAFPVGIKKDELIICVPNPCSVEVINRMKKKLEWGLVYLIKLWKQIPTGDVIDIKVKFVVSHIKSIEDAIRSFSGQYPDKW